jgi:hypothetical protein
MGAIKLVKNAFIGKVLNKSLEGFTGSNIIGAVLVVVVGSDIDYVDAIEGFKFEDMKKSMESAKLVGAIAVGLFTWFVGRKEAKGKKEEK